MKFSEIYNLIGGYVKIFNSRGALLLIETDETPFRRLSKFFSREIVSIEPVDDNTTAVYIKA